LDVSKVDQKLHLSSPPSAVLSLPVPLGHPYDATTGSFRIGGAVLPSSLVFRTARLLRGAQNGV
jgi:hypothetical protein